MEAVHNRLERAGNRVHKTPLFQRSRKPWVGGTRTFDWSRASEAGYGTDSSRDL